MNTTISGNLFGAFLRCPTKCYLRSCSDKTTGNAYADWVQTQEESYHKKAIKRLIERVTPDKVVFGLPITESLKMAKWQLAVDFVARAQNLESNLHAVERSSYQEQNEPAQFIPVRFIFTNILTSYDKLLLAFDGFVLSEVLGCKVTHGKLIHGDSYTTMRVNISALANEVRKLTGKIATSLYGNSPPDLILNRHCIECEFQARCRQKAIEADDLSLLSGMTEKERNKHRSKGIFTVNQLSYTFRPRRRRKRAKNPARPHYLALQALSIRENTVHIHGEPQLADSRSRVYLDIEGLPDDQFYYLIGALVVSDGQETFHTFWADQDSDEPIMFTQFIQMVSQLADFRVFHYGDYEAIALRHIKAKLPEFHHPKIEAVLKRATNVMSVVHPHIYFPTYSNGLKDIGNFLGYKRRHDSATGLQTIVWRKTWEINGDPDIKASLVQYNQDDCRTLKNVCDFIWGLTSPDAPSHEVFQIPPKITRTEEMTIERSSWEVFRAKEYALERMFTPVFL